MIFLGIHYNKCQQKWMKQQYDKVNNFSFIG